MPDPLLSWAHDGHRSLAESEMTGTNYVVRDTADGAAMYHYGRPPGAYYSFPSREAAFLHAERCERDRREGVSTPSPYAEVAHA